MKVTADSGKLRLGAAAKFMTAKLTRHNGMFVISIKNISEGDYETPFSSGVWGVTGTAVEVSTMNLLQPCQNWPPQGTEANCINLLRKKYQNKITHFQWS